MNEEDWDLEGLKVLAPNECKKLITALKEGPIKDIFIKLSQCTNIEYIEEILNNENSSINNNKINKEIYQECVNEYIKKTQVAKENFKKAKKELEEAEENNKRLLKNINKLATKYKEEEIKEYKIKIKEYKKEINKDLGKPELEGIETNTNFIREKPTWVTILKKDKVYKEVTIKEEKKTPEYEEFVKISELVPIIVKAKIDGFSTKSIRRKLNSMGIKNSDIIFISTINSILTEIIIKKEVLENLKNKLTHIGLTVIQALAYEKLPFSNLSEIESAKAAYLRWTNFNKRSTRCNELFNKLANKAIEKLSIEAQEELKKKQDIKIIYTPSEPPKYNKRGLTKRIRLYESPITEFITPKNNRVLNILNENKKTDKAIPSIINPELEIKKIDWADMKVPILEGRSNNNKDKKENNEILNSNKTNKVVVKESNISNNE